MKKVIEKYKRCICFILQSKYTLDEAEALKAIDNSCFGESLKIDENVTLHTDPEEWADDIYEYIYRTDSKANN